MLLIYIQARQSHNICTTLLNSYKGTDFKRLNKCSLLNLTTCHHAFGRRRSSQHKGKVVFFKSETMNSPDDWETMCIPISLRMSLRTVDFPLAVSPTAVGTGHEPVKF